LVEDAVKKKSVLYQNRPQYYQAIQEARRSDDSGVFIEFTLGAIYETIMQVPAASSTPDE
jgi:Fic family protein